MISTARIRGEERKEFAYQINSTEFRLSAMLRDGSTKLIGKMPLSDHKDLTGDKRTEAFISDLLKKAVEEGHVLADELEKGELKYIAYPTIEGSIMVGEDYAFANYTL